MLAFVNEQIEVGTTLVDNIAKGMEELMGQAYAEGSDAGQQMMAWLKNFAKLEQDEWGVDPSVFEAGREVGVQNHNFKPS